MPRAHQTHEPSRTLLKRIGRNVARTRRESGWSQPELAILLGIDKMTVSRIERGLSNISIATLERLARQFGVQPHDLLSP
jgi:transcriptional regulator with XRE-family HTH domain